MRSPLTFRPARLRRSSGTPRSPIRRIARWFGAGRALALALLVVLVAVRIWDPAPVESLRLRVFDFFQAVQPRPLAAERPVVIVDIDEASLREYGQWPWPRTLVARLVEGIAAAGADVIGFDVVFAEPDRLSPATVATSLPGLDEPTRDVLRKLPDNDRLLAAAIAGSRVVLGQTAVGAGEAAGDIDLARQTGIAVLGPDPGRFLPRFPGILPNVPVLNEAAAGRGLFTITPERDGIVRRVPMVVSAGGRILPTLTLEMLRVLTGAGALVLRADEDGMVSVRLGDVELPTDRNGQIWVHFARPDPAKFVPAADILAGRVDPARLAGKIVLVGTSAIGLLDNKTTPTARSMPGVEVHAQVLESALQGEMLSEPSYALPLELVATVAIAFAIVLFAPLLGALPLLLLGAAVAGCLGAASWYRYAHQGILLDATFPLAASFAVYATIVFTNYVREELGRNRIRSAFGRYISPALVEQLAQSPEALKLGGEERRMTILFSDVRGFTTIAETFKADPQGLTALMNGFLTPLTDAILDHRGTIDKYMGDAIMAFWNAPLTDPRQEHNACAAALEMLRRLARVNVDRAREDEAAGRPHVPIAVGIGLNTGTCVVGNMGSTLRFDYSVLGDTVNLASRLEGQSKTYGVAVVLGSATAEIVRRDYAVIEIDRLRVKGKREPEAVHALLGDAAIRASDAFDRLSGAHEALLARYRAADFASAAALVAACRSAAAPFDLGGLYDLYDQRIAAFLRQPPPAGWDGVHVADSK